MKKTVYELLDAIKTTCAGWAKSRNYKKEANMSNRFRQGELVRVKEGRPFAGREGYIQAVSSSDEKGSPPFCYEVDGDEHRTWIAEEHLEPVGCSAELTAGDSG